MAAKVSSKNLRSEISLKEKSELTVQSTKTLLI